MKFSVSVENGKPAPHFGWNQKESIPLLHEYKQIFPYFFRGNVLIRLKGNEAIWRFG